MSATDPQLTPAVNRLRNTLTWTRKARSFEEVDAVVTPAQIKALLGDETLQVLNAPELWNVGNAHPMHDWDKTPTGEPIVFILVLDGERMYLVNTEGYTYCRYIARIMEPANLAAFDNRAEAQAHAEHYQDEANFERNYTAKE